MITVNNFVGEFLLKKDDDARKAYVKSHLTASYMSYIHKMTVCDSIVKASDYKTVPIGNIDKTYFAPNSANRYFFFIIQILKDYTDIKLVGDDIDINDEKAVTGAMMQTFDRLEEVGITNIIIELLGAEYQALKIVLQMKVDDTYFIESSLPSYVETKMDSLNAVATQLQKIAESNDN